MERNELIEIITNQLNNYQPHLYHTIYFNNKEYSGQRNCLDRVKNIFCIPWVKILDLGCNIGGMLWPYRLHTPGVIGIDKNNNHVEFCKKLAEFYAVNNKYQFFNLDINHVENLNFLKEKGKFDIIFLLAMTQHLSNWKDVIKWSHENSELLLIEFNGQPEQIKEYIEYTKTLRPGMDFLFEEDHRYLYMCYVPIKFEINGKTYETYKYNIGTNVDVYYCNKENVVIKLFKNCSYFQDVCWSKKLKCAPEIRYIDFDKNIVIQEYCGINFNYFSAPDDYQLQIEKIKNELYEKKCNGEDVEMHVKDNKIKLVDLGACSENKILGGRIDMELKFISYRREQFLKGQKITA